eukprot:403355376
MKTAVLFTTLVALMSYSSASQISLQATKTFGEDNKYIKAIEGGLGVTFAAYNQLLQRDSSQTQADECYKDLWALTDDITSSFNAIGRPTEIKDWISSVVSAFNLIKSTMMSVKACFPLYMESPPAYVPIEVSTTKFILTKVLALASSASTLISEPDMLNMSKAITTAVLTVQEIVMYIKDM